MTTVSYYIEAYWSELIMLMNDMSVWLLVGFLFAGLLHVVFPEQYVKRYMGGNNLRSVTNASLLGVPLPLCSCGVIPTGISFFKNGASKPASVSFLISTPQTGIDSILVTYSMLGLPFAILRPVVALVTGMVGGIAEILTGKKEVTPIVEAKASNVRTSSRRWTEIFHYGFVEFLQDIANWLIIGLLIAALIALFVPDDFFASYITSPWMGMLIILAASVPMYICATSSVPIAAVLMMKGLSPGAALVFLMAGPATNAATIAVIGNTMGRRTLLTYLASIIGGAMLFGLLVDYLLPAQWFVHHHIHHAHHHQLLPGWIYPASSVLLTGIILYAYLEKFVLRRQSNRKNQTIQPGQLEVMVQGMNCNHCKRNVETNLMALAGVSFANADLATGKVILQGENLDETAIKNTIEKIGYKAERLK